MVALVGRPPRGAAPLRAKSRTPQLISQSIENENTSWFSRRNLGSIGNCSPSACWFGCAVRGALFRTVSIQHARKPPPPARLRIACQLYPAPQRRLFDGPVTQGSSAGHPSAV